MKQLLVAAGIALVAACGLDQNQSAIQSAATTNTVVSLTFDDTLADQFQVGDMAAARGMRVDVLRQQPALRRRVAT